MIVQNFKAILKDFVLVNVNIKTIYLVHEMHIYMWVSGGKKFIFVVYLY